MTETAAPDAPATTPGAEQLGAYAEFLSTMEELGLLKDLEDDLPDGFSAIFEIARIVADPAGRAASGLASALRLAEPQDSEEAAPESLDAAAEHRVEVPAGEEYEAEFIRSWSDVQYVYSWQYLLPDEVFVRRLAERRLWFPMAKSPTIRRIDVGENDFDPTPSKQKVYVLMDTSASMSVRHRFAYCKAIILRFLRENRRELGEIFLRTFDVDLGPLHVARTAEEYDALLKRIAKQRLLGNGTCLERAILAACHDIRAERFLTGAEILVVTDGAAHVEEGRLRTELGSSVRLHCVKIGGVRVFADKSYLDDVLDYSTASTTRREQRILQLRDRTTKLEDALKYARDVTTRRTVEAGLRECAIEREVISKELREDYGCEIERIADVFVEVPDLDVGAILGLDPDRLMQLMHLAQQVIEDLERTPATPETLKNAALVLTHLVTLAAEQRDAAMQGQVDMLRDAIEHKLESAIAAHERTLSEAPLLSQNDQRDLRVLLMRGTGRYSSLWLAMVRYLYTAVSGWFKR